MSFTCSNSSVYEVGMLAWLCMGDIELSTSVAYYIITCSLILIMYMCMSRIQKVMSSNLIRGSSFSLKMPPSPPLGIALALSFGNLQGLK